MVGINGDRSAQTGTLLGMRPRVARSTLVSRWLAAVQWRTAVRRGRHPAAWLAAGFGLLGVGYRLALLVAEIPPTNSDEATSGLVALHIAQGREFPLYFYGQYYMGALESYLAAPLFLVAGPSNLALRLPNLLLYVAFLALMWHLTRRLYGPGLAVATVALFALGSDRIVKNQLIAGGGYPEMNPAGALLMLLAANLGLGVWQGGGRLRAYAGWGLVAGLTLWDDWLVMPYVGAAGALLIAANWRELWGRAGLALAGGLAVGLVPFVAHNLTAPPERRSLTVYTSLGTPEVASWGDRWHGGVLLGVPMGTGLCDPGRCEPWQMWWAVAYPILLAAAGALAVWALRRLRTLAPAAARAERVRQWARLALVGAAVLSLLAYVSSDAAGTTPVESSRYLSCLLITTPAVLWPLWSVAGRGRRRWDPHRAGGAAPRRTGRAPQALVRFLAALPLGALAATMGVATAAVLAAAPELSREAADRRELVAALDRMGIDRMYGEYWTCNPITFVTRERMICAVIRDDLQAGWDRYLPHRDLVDAASNPAYVLPAGSPLSRAVAAHLTTTGIPVEVSTVAGYDIYRPSTRPNLPLR